jgi:hypothetical protein
MGQRLRIANPNVWSDGVKASGLLISDDAYLLEFDTDTFTSPWKYGGVRIICIGVRVWRAIRNGDVCVDVLYNLDDSTVEVVYDATHIAITNFRVEFVDFLKLTL